MEQDFSKHTHGGDLMEQGSPEWFKARLGKVTASRVSDVVSKTKTGYSTSRAKYMTQLLIERITGEPVESYTNPAMERGIEQEQFARAAYEAHANVLVDQCGSFDHPSIPMSSASPDGLVNQDGQVEIKNPMSHTHLETLITKKVPGDYVIQMQWQMACTGRKWCDFVSYDSRMPEHLRLFVRRVERDDELIAELEKEVVKFLSELEDKLDKLKEI